MVYSKRRKAQIQSVQNARQCKRQKTDSVGEENSVQTANTKAKHSPPHVSSASVMLFKLKQILEPRRKTGYGRKLCRLNNITRTRCQAMAMCLRRYTIEPRESFIRSSVETARMMGRGSVSYARRVRQWIRRYEATGKLPTHTLDRRNQLAINNEAVAGELRLLLRARGKYFGANDIVNILADPDAREEIGIPKAISIRTARRWLRKMNYDWKNEPKGQYFDGHERPDVVTYRSNVYLPAWTSIEPFLQQWDDETGLPLPLQLSSGQRRIVAWFHDATTFTANDRKKKRWVHRSKRAQPVKKGEGASFGVSDYISEHGFLQSHNGALSARRTLLPGTSRDGYWTNEDICEQLEAAVKLTQKEYPAYDHVFVYDNARIHTKKRPTAPSARNMRKFPHAVEPGKPRMEDVVFPDGSTQSFYYPDNHPQHPGHFKGMLQILRERGIKAGHLNAQCKNFKCDPMATECCCRRILFNIIDVNSTTPTILETLAHSLGSRVIFLPKYHCELNPIEQVWGYAKSRYRQYPESSRVGNLKSNALKALGEVPVMFMQRYIHRAHRFTRAYRSGKDGTEAARWARRIFKRHRTTPEHIPVDQI